MSYLGIIVWACVVGLASGHAWSVAPMRASDLARDCTIDDSSEDVPERCAVYIAGFLDGAVATDARVAENVIREFEQKRSTLTERAIRTRLGHRMQTHGPSVYAEYCVGDPVPVQEVMIAVRRGFEQTPPGEEDLARDAVYTVLRSSYPCRE